MLIGHDDAFSACFRRLEGEDMRESDVSNVDKNTWNAFGEEVVEYTIAE